MKVGQNIKQLRELKNYTQTYMADKLSMSVGSYCKLEKGQTDITFSKIEQIAKVLGVEISNLLNFDSHQIFNISQNQKDSSYQSGYIKEQKNFETDGYKELIVHLKKENEFLKELLKSKT